VLVLGTLIRSAIIKIRRIEVKPNIARVEVHVHLVGVEGHLVGSRTCVSLVQPPVQASDADASASSAARDVLASFSFT
jgi:hypothetical protein